MSSYSSTDLANHLVKVQAKIKEGADPKQAFLKYAKANDMPAPVLEHMVQEWNRLRTCSVFKTAKDRREVVEPLNAAAIAKEFTESFGKKKAAAEPDTRIYWNGVPELDIRPAVITSFPSRKVASLNLDDPKPEPKKASASTAPAVAQDLLNQAKEGFQQFCREASKLAFSEPGGVARILEGLSYNEAKPEEWAPVLGAMKRAGVEIPHKTESIKHLLSEEHDPLYAAMAEAKRAHEAVTLANQVLDEAKVAFGINLAHSPMRRPLERPEAATINKPNVVTERFELPDVPEIAFPDTNPVFKAFGNAATYAMMPKKNRRQLDLDKALQIARSQVTVKKIFSNDTVLQKAYAENPNGVSELVASVMKKSPSLADDPPVLAGVLREAVQYGAMPRDMVESLNKLEEGSLKNKQLSRNLESSVYDMSYKPVAKP
jgi:hypothetical protein